MRNLLAKKMPVSDVVAFEAPAEEIQTSYGSYRMLGWLIVLILVGGFLLWSFFAPLDAGVPVPSTVMVATNTKAVQHPTGGTVDEILVKEGDIVKAGQPLIKMNDIQAKGLAESARWQYFTARAAEARLIAERDGKKTIAFPPELETTKADPRVANTIGLQSQLFMSRQLALQSELGSMEEAIAGFKSQIKGLQDSSKSKKDQMAFLKEQLDGMRDLAKDGYVARNRLLDLERTYAQLSGSISEDLGNIGRLQRQVSETTMRRIQRQQEYQKEVRTQLSDTQRDADALGNRLTTLDFDMSNTEVKAPVDGTVVGLNVFTKGAVVGPGFKLMDIVPSDDPLIIEGRVPTNLIDKVRVNMPVEMMFAAFNANKTPHIPGIVTYLAADRMVDEKTGQSFYKMRAKVAPQGKKLLADLQIRPGMPVEVFVITGERTMMSYLMKPIMDRAKTSMSED